MTTHPSPTPPPLRSGELVYLYAVGRAPGPARPALPLTGVAGGPVTTVTADGLTAFVSTVPSADFHEDGLTAQLEDLARLERLARAHHEVVQSLTAGGLVLPMRLATVYHDERRVTEMLHAAREEFHARLDLLDGHAEWGVKVFADTSATDPGDQESAPAGTTGPGRDYLRRRRAQRGRAQAARRAAGQAAARVRGAAAGLAAASLAHRLQQGELAPFEGENVLNDAYLVPEAGTEEFRAAVQAAGAGLDGVRVEITGPWSPYSFATPPRTAAEDDSAR